MLSALAVCAAITALIAGIAGAWSPCGFSMLDTIGTTLGDARRSLMLLACATFTLGAVLGGALTFGGLALLGEAIGRHVGSLRELAGVLLAVVAAIADWRGVKIAPQIRRQVPERWRWTMPLPIACGLYGVLLGLGFTTFVLTFAVWALAGLSFIGASPALGLLVGVAFGVGRALPVIWMAPSLGSEQGLQRLDRMASEPRLWLGLRRLDALGLCLCALFLGGTAANAAVLANATDPSVSQGGLVWQQLNGTGMLRLSSGALSVLPGEHPALGQATIAWESNGLLTVADRDSMTPRATFAVAGLTGLAVSNDWVVYREQEVGGRESLIGISLNISGSPPRYLRRAGLAGEIGRPVLDGSTVVFAYDTPRSNAIESLNLATGVHSVLRSTSADYGLLNPSLLSGRLLYERVSRCAQELRLGSPRSAMRDRVLLRLASTVQRDPGYQPGYEHAYNSASLCSRRRVGGSGRTQMGATALSATTAYVTETSSGDERSHILALRR
jgi:hypothetical protein